MHGHALFVPASNSCHDFFIITQSSGKKNVNNNLVLEINTSYLLFTFLMFRRTASEVFVYEGVMNICSKIAGDYPCGSVVSKIKLLGNSIEIIFPYGYFPVNLLHIFRTPFYKNTFERLLLYVTNWVHQTGAIQGVKRLPWKHWKKLEKNCYELLLTKSVWAWFCLTFCLVLNKLWEHKKRNWVNV